MRPSPLLASSAVLCVVLLPLATPSCGGSTTTPAEPGGGGSAGTPITSTDTCVTNDDCAWGEIPKEILKSSDCICLFGCPYLAQTKVTATRRGDQYKALCDPHTDGKGQPCGIDDCALPGSIACVDGMCKAAPKDGGMTQ